MPEGPPATEPRHPDKVKTSGRCNSGLPGSCSGAQTTKPRTVTLPICYRKLQYSSSDDDAWRNGDNFSTRTISEYLTNGYGNTYRTLNVDRLFMTRRVREREMSGCETCRRPRGRRLFWTTVSSAAPVTSDISLSTARPDSLMKPGGGEAWMDC